MNISFKESLGGGFYRTWEGGEPVAVDPHEAAEFGKEFHLYTGRKGHDAGVEDIGIEEIQGTGDLITGMGDG